MRSKVHYNTFDGLNYNLLTGCSYYLVHDSDPSSKFDIIVHNDPNINYNTTVKRTVSIVADGKTVKLGQKIGDMFIVQIIDSTGNKMVQLPYEGVPRISEVNYSNRERASKRSLGREKEKNSSDTTALIIYRSSPSPIRSVLSL